MDSTFVFCFHIGNIRFHFWLSVLFSAYYIKQNFGGGGGKCLIINKLQRLILPSVIFSAIYFPLFYEYKGIWDLLYKLISGCGHMWFLPMLFWCFIFGWILEQIKIGDGWKLGILICINLFWPISLPLRLGEMANYLFYFYAGYFVYKYRDVIKPWITPKYILWSWIVFVILFIILRPMEGTVIIGDQSDRFFRLLSFSFHKFCRLIYATMGMFSFYFTAFLYTQRKQLNQFVIRLASCSFGIYLFHQFILKGIYYKTGFAAIVGPYCLPWFGFLIAAPLSYLLSILLLKTKTGSYLIG